MCAVHWEGLCYNRAAAKNRNDGVLVDLVAKRFYVSGTVQGVGFRYFAERLAQQTRLSGYARNLSDGRVEVYAMGTAAQLNSLRTELIRGPRMARVERVAEVDAEVLPEYAAEFTIERDS